MAATAAAGRPRAPWGSSAFHWSVAHSRGGAGYLLFLALPPPPILLLLLFLFLLLLVLLLVLLLLLLLLFILLLFLLLLIFLLLLLMLLMLLMLLFLLLLFLLLPFLLFLLFLFFLLLLLLLLSPLLVILAHSLAQQWFRLQFHTRRACNNVFFLGAKCVPPGGGGADRAQGHEVGLETVDMVLPIADGGALEKLIRGSHMALGGEVSLSVGPVGRSYTKQDLASTSGQRAPCKAYSHSRGLYGGVSLQGGVVTTRRCVLWRHSSCRCGHSATVYRAGVLSARV